MNRLKKSTQKGQQKNLHKQNTDRLKYLNDIKG